MMSTTVSELGAVYCSIVSFANTREHQEIARSEIVQSLVAIRLKLKRSLVLKTNIVYEVCVVSSARRLLILIPMHASSLYEDGGRPSATKRFSTSSCKHCLLLCVQSC